MQTRTRTTRTLACPPGDAEKVAIPEAVPVEYSIYFRPTVKGIEHTLSQHGDGIGEGTVTVQHRLPPTPPAAPARLRYRTYTSPAAHRDARARRQPATADIITRCRPRRGRAGPAAAAAIRRDATLELFATRTHRPSSTSRRTIRRHHVPPRRAHLCRRSPSLVTASWHRPTRSDARARRKGDNARPTGMPIWARPSACRQRAPLGHARSHPSAANVRPWVTRGSRGAGCGINGSRQGNNFAAATRPARARVRTTNEGKPCQGPAPPNEPLLPIAPLVLLIWGWLH